MAATRLNLDPDVVLEWLLDRGYVEHTSSANAPYRIAINEDDFLPYSVTFLSKKLSERFSKTKLISTHRRVWCRELLKCFDEYQIKYDDKGTRGSMFWEFRDTTKKYLEQKLGIDLDAIHEHDRKYRNEHKCGTRYTSYWHQQLKRYGEERALQLFMRYYERRMEDLNKDCRKGRPQRIKFEED
jgi:hypothetical protein